MEGEEGDQENKEIKEKCPRVQGAQEGRTDPQGVKLTGPSSEARDRPSWLTPAIGLWETCRFLGHKNP